MLDTILNVNNLAAGASVVVIHNLPGIPNSVMPSKLTPITVVSVTATSVTFRNDGSKTESASFLARIEHSIQSTGLQSYWSGLGSNIGELLNASDWSRYHRVIEGAKLEMPTTPSYIEDLGGMGDPTDYIFHINANITAGVILAGQYAVDGEPPEYAGKPMVNEFAAKADQDVHAANGGTVIANGEEIKLTVIMFSNLAGVYGVPGPIAPQLTARMATDAEVLAWIAANIGPTQTDKYVTLGMTSIRRIGPGLTSDNFAQEVFHYHRSW